MSELQPGLHPESSLEDATRLFGKLAGVALENSVWTPWERRSQPDRRHRNRRASYEREVPVRYSHIEYPNDPTPEWPGPTYTLEEAQGTVNRRLVIDQLESALHIRYRLKRQLYTPDSTSFTIAVTNKKAIVPDLHSPRDLTETERASLERCGGGARQIVFSDRGIPEMHYQVDQVGEVIRDVQTSSPSHFRSDFRSGLMGAGLLQDLVVINNLLHEEIKPDI